MMLLPGDCKMREEVVSWLGAFRIRQELPDQRVREMGIAHSGPHVHEEDHHRQMKGLL
jgi:hypothetical protein